MDHTVNIPEREQRYIDVDGVKTFFVCGGSGPAVLLIHGGSPGACTLINWKLNLEPLMRAGFRVYAYDQPGFGLSGIPSDHSMEARVHHAAAFLATIPAERVNVMGNSMGAYIGARLALDHANVDRLILISSSTLAPQGSAQANLLAKSHVDELRSYEPSLEAMRRMTLKTLFRQELVSEELVRERFEMSKGHLYEAGKARDAVRGFKSLANDLHHISNPTLLLWGADDPGAAVERALLLLDKLPNAELHVFKHCGHWLQWDQSERFLHLCSDFLRNCR